MQLPFNINEIIKLLPHSYPFLLIDRVIEYESCKSAKAIKNVTFNEYYFSGHFPDHPVMPGVLIIEAMAQTSAVCVLNQEDKKVVYFMSIENAKFRKPVIPGDTLVLHSQVINHRQNTCKFSCGAYVEDDLVAEATILAMIQNDKKSSDFSLQ